VARLNPEQANVTGVTEAKRALLVSAPTNLPAPSTPPLM